MTGGAGFSLWVADHPSRVFLWGGTLEGNRQCNVVAWSFLQHASKTMCWLWRQAINDHCAAWGRQTTHLAGGGKKIILFHSFFQRKKGTRRKKKPLKTPAKNTKTCEKTWKSAENILKGTGKTHKNRWKLDFCASNPKGNLQKIFLLLIKWTEENIFPISYFMLCQGQNHAWFMLYPCLFLCKMTTSIGPEYTDHPPSPTHLARGGKNFYNTPPPGACTGPRSKVNPRANFRGAKFAC